MITGRVIPPGDSTRDGYARQLDARLYQELILLTIGHREISDRVRAATRGGAGSARTAVLIDALDDEALLERRITLLQMQLALSRARR
jgi:hypothetical protein